METESSNKRQRTDMEEILHLSNMPDSILTHVTSYLTKESSILFAAGVTTPSSTDNNFHVTAGHLSSTILSSLQSESSWIKLDVGDLEQYKVLPYSTNLTDDDLYSVLVAIDAINNLKSLQLTGCTKVTGRGLEPLRGSAVIESIDLGLANCGQSPTYHCWGDKVPEIAEKDVLPILDSIVATEDNALKFIMLPKKWRDAQTAELTEFLGRYNKLLVSRRSECSKCNAELTSTERMAMVVNDQGSDCFGIQSYCCNMCLKNYCYDCEKEFEGTYGWSSNVTEQLLSSCENCEKEYCGECIRMGYCGKCEKQKCSSCAPVKNCDGCSEDVCKACDAGRWCYHTTADYRCGPCNQGE